MKKNQALSQRLENYSRSASAIRAMRRGLSSRGVRYSAAAAAGAALVGASPADAALITSPNQGQMFSTFSGAGNGSLDVDGDGNGDIGVAFGASFFYWSGFSSTFPSTTFTTLPGFSSPGFGSRTNFGELRGRVRLTEPSANLSAFGLSTTVHRESHSSFPVFPPYSPPAGLFSTFTRNRTFGISFTAGSNTSGTPNLGWLQAVFQFAPGYTKISFPTVVYNTTPGGPVHVGDVPGVPEPSSIGLMGLGLLALGARGLREQRRRKKKADRQA